MVAAVLWDTRAPGGFCIEMEAARYMRAVGPAAWSVYSFLIQYATRAGRPASWPALDTIAEHCGLAEPEVHHAIRQLARYRLLEFTDESRDPGRPATRVCRIVGLQRVDEQPTATPEVAADVEWSRALTQGNFSRRMFDALAGACGYSPADLDDAVRDQIFAAVTLIQSAGGDPEQVHEAARLYRQIVPDLPLTPRNLAVSWKLLARGFSATYDEAS